MKITLLLAAAGSAVLSPMARTFFGSHPSKPSRTAIGEMQTLDDRTLADIGVDRATLDFAQHNGHLPQRRSAEDTLPAKVLRFGRRARKA